TTADEPDRPSELLADAMSKGRQPLIPSDSAPPGFGSFTAFNIAANDAVARESILKELFELSKSITAQHPPKDFAQYFSKSTWKRLRPSIAMVYGLGPSAYDAARFGDRIAASKPADLHPITYDQHLKFDAKSTQKDILVRVTSDSLWFNQQ